MVTCATMSVSQSCNVSVGQITDMDVVTNACAIGGVVVVAINVQGLTPPYGHLRQEGHEVVGNALRVFAHLTTGMRTHRIEIAQ